jgi:hypothetical protein
MKDMHRQTNEQTRKPAGMDAGRYGTVAPQHCSNTVPYKYGCAGAQLYGNREIFPHREMETDLRFIIPAMNYRSLSINIYLLKNSMK